MREAAIVSTARTPIGKAFRGAFNQTHGATLTGHAIKHAVRRAGVDADEIKDVIIGCGLPEGATGKNIARLSAIRAEAVRTQLLARGVEPDRLITLGLGHTDPIADNLTKTGKAANRRIEFLLLREGETGLPPPPEAGESNDITTGS